MIVPCPKKPDHGECTGEWDIMITKIRGASSMGFSENLGYEITYMESVGEHECDSAVDGEMTEEEYDEMIEYLLDNLPEPY